MSAFTKVYSRQAKKEINYAKPRDILQELRLLEKQKGWAIFEAIEVLKEGKADSFSFTKDSPYQYFYARITEECVIFKFKTREKESEFKLSLEQLI